MSNEGIEGMRSVKELTNDELLLHYAIAINQYNNGYKAKKEIEEEMAKRGNMIKNYRR